MREPQRLRRGIGCADGDGVGEGRRRPVEHAGRLLDAEQRGCPRRGTEPEGVDRKPDRSNREAGEDDEPNRVRNDPPQAEPGHDGEEAGEDEDGCDHRPHRLPEEDQPRPPDGALDSAAGLGLDRRG